MVAVMRTKGVLPTSIKAGIQIFPAASEAIVRQKIFYFQKVFAKLNFAPRPFYNSTEKH
jgi:hypothetical protein